MSRKNDASRRLMRIVEAHGLQALALEHARYFGIDTENACEFAPCVCAAAFDKYREEPKKADTVCDEVWADSVLIAESGRRSARDQSLSFLETVGAHTVECFENRYVRDIERVVCVLKCPGCGHEFRMSYERATRTFRHRCPKCNFS